MIIQETKHARAFDFPRGPNLDDIHPQSATNVAHSGTKSESSSAINLKLASILVARARCAFARRLPLGPLLNVLLTTAVLRVVASRCIARKDRSFPSFAQRIRLLSWNLSHEIGRAHV